MGFELTKSLAQVLVTDAKESSQLKLTLWSVIVEGIEDSLGERALDGNVFLEQFETHGRLLGKRQSEIRPGWGEAVLTTQEQEVTSSLQIEIGIAPGVEVGAASEGLSSRALLLHLPSTTPGAGWCHSG